MPLRQTVKMSDELHASLKKYAEEKNITFQEAMEKLFVHNRKLNDRNEELEIEIARLKTVGASQPITQVISKPTTTPTNAGAEDALAPTRDLAVQEAPVPFEVSKNSPKALTNTLPSLNSGDSTGKPTLQDRLWYQEEKARIRIETAKKIEEVKQVVREQVRRHHNRPGEDEIRARDTFSQPCPLGHTRNHCLNNLCDRKGQCARDGIIKTGMSNFSIDNGGPVDIPYVA